MGALPASPPGTKSWRIAYRGGGPLDGLIEAIDGPADCPIIKLVGTLTDGPFVGDHVYVRTCALPGPRTVEMEYRGERWRGNFAA